jgi:hypothetical protein
MSHLKKETLASVQIRPVHYSNNQARESTQQHQHKAQQVQQACYYKPDKFIFSNWGKKKISPWEWSKIDRNMLENFKTFKTIRSF